MPKIIITEADGQEHEVEIEVGSTIMQGAVDNMIDGILAECGGVCSCATCHCYIEEQWIGKLSEADELEKEMLANVLDLKPNSRLSCQVTITEDMEGMRVVLPESQY